MIGVVSLSPHILIFDSGIGGTSVLKHIQALIPSAQYSYVMDNKYLPYGEQDKQFLNQRIVSLLSQLDKQLGNIDLLVVACNTASTQTLALLRHRLSIPIVGVVPAIKPAAEITQTGVIGLLATPATISTQYTHDLISDFAKAKQVLLKGSTKLVALAEQYYWTNDIDLKALEHELKQCQFPKDMDVLVLGCTHFPIIASFIKELLPQNCQLVDSGEAIARRVQSLLAQQMQFTQQEVVIKKPLQHYATAFIEQGKLNIKQIDY